MKDPSFSYCYLCGRHLGALLRSIFHHSPPRSKRGLCGAGPGDSIKKLLVHSFVFAFVKRDRDQNEDGAQWEDEKQMEEENSSVDGDWIKQDYILRN